MANWDSTNPTEETEMTSWTSDKTGWLMALGGAVVGYIAVKALEHRKLNRNPGMVMKVGGFVVHVSVGGQDPGKYSLSVERPHSKLTEFIGYIKQTGGNMFRAFPPEGYARLDVRSTLSPSSIENGVIKRSLHDAAAYLVEAYQDHYLMSGVYRRLHKQRLGKEFSRAMGA